jgi:FlaA1/EpsC-like NDP-sugar epimerase
VEAILAAGAAGCSGKILLPDLGEPKSIAALARSLIDSTRNDSNRNGAGHAIPIRYIGLRPGEKLTEDLIYATEVREGRVSDTLEVIRTVTPTAAELHESMARIACLVASADLAGLIEAVSAMVPEYRPSSVILEAMGARK